MLSFNEQLVRSNRAERFEVSCQMAVQWILAHPNESLEIVSATPEHGQRFLSRVKELLEQGGIHEN